MTEWILVAAACSLSAVCGFFLCAALTVGKQSDADAERARLRHALRVAHVALMFCAEHAGAGSSEALAAAITCGKVLNHDRNN